MAVWSSRCCLTSLPGCRGGTSACSDYKGCSMQLTRYVSMPGARWCVPHVHFCSLHVLYAIWLPCDAGTVHKVFSLLYSGYW